MPKPTSTNMKFKFPEFIPVDDGTMEFAIEEAVVTCGDFTPDSEWIDDANQTLAIMYYAAHLLMVSIMRQQSGGGQVIASESTPELKVTYAVPKTPSFDEPIDLTMTIYGVRYLGLVERNHPPILTINSAMRM
jgi:hypothetical protein